MANDRQLKTLRMDLHVTITDEGRIIGGGIEAKSYHGGPTLLPTILETKELRDQLARLVFDLDSMAKGTRREVEGTRRQV